MGTYTFADLPGGQIVVDVHEARFKERLASERAFAIRRAELTSYDGPPERLFPSVQLFGICDASLEGQLVFYCSAVTVPVMQGWTTDVRLRQGRRSKTFSLSQQPRYLDRFSDGRHVFIPVTRDDAARRDLSLTPALGNDGRLITLAQLDEIGVDIDDYLLRRGLLLGADEFSVTARHGRSSVDLLPWTRIEEHLTYVHDAAMRFEEIYTALARALPGGRVSARMLSRTS